MLKSFIVFIIVLLLFVTPAWARADACSDAKIYGWRTDHYISDMGELCDVYQVCSGNYCQSITCCTPSGGGDSGEMVLVPSQLDFGDVLLGDVRYLSLRIDTGPCHSGRKHCGLRVTWESPEAWRIYGDPTNGPVTLLGETQWQLLDNEKRTLTVRLQFAPNTVPPGGSYQIPLYVYRVYSDRVWGKKEVKIIGQVNPTPSVAPAVTDLIME